MHKQLMMPQAHLTHDHDTLYNSERISILRNKQDLLLKTTKGKVLIREEMIHLYHHHRTIMEVIQTSMMMIQMMGMTAMGERGAGRYAHHDNHLCPEICLQKQELY